MSSSDLIHTETWLERVGKRAACGEMERVEKKKSEDRRSSVEQLRLGQLPHPSAALILVASELHEADSMSRAKER